MAKGPKTDVDSSVVSEELKQGAQAWVAGDIPKAKELFLKGANQGDPRGFYWVARCFLKEMNPQESFKNFLKAADEGYTGAYLEVARAYHEGHGVKKSVEESLKFYSLAMYEGMLDDGSLAFIIDSEHPPLAEKGIQYFEEVQPVAFPETCYQLAWRYLEGKNVAQSDQKAGQLLHKAAAAGHTPSQIILAKAHLFGTWGQSQDEVKGFNQLKDLAEDGHAQALCDLGVCYWLGLGCDISHEKAMHAWEQATELNKHYIAYSILCHVIGKECTSQYLLDSHDALKRASQHDAWAAYLFQEFERMRLWETIQRNGILAKFTDPVKKDLADRFEHYLKGDFFSVHRIKKIHSRKRSS